MGFQNTYLLAIVIASCFLSVICEKNEETSIFRFQTADATSFSAGINYAGEFNPENALQAGNSFWRSADDIKSESIVWTGRLPATANAIGVRINWVYSPAETQIQSSIDGINFHIAIPWRHATQEGQEYIEDFMFNSSEDVKAIKIQMKGIRHQYFGIRHILVIGSGLPLTLIMSGITDASGDNCLQISDGAINKDGAQVVLDSCIYGMAAGDGRELWRTTQNGNIVSALSNPPKCLAVLDGEIKNGAVVTMQDCQIMSEVQDNRGVWEFNSAAQLQLHGTNMCLYQGNKIGDGVGVSIINSNATATSTMDAAHNADYLVDHDKKTFWASNAFDDSYEHIVAVDLDLGDSYQIRNVKIDWEYPALTYSIETSDSGKFTEALSIFANPSNTTSNEISGIVTRYVRVVMKRPHPRYSKVDGKFLYGIREVEVTTNNLRTVLMFCPDAQKSTDARDKYFPIYVEEYNFLASEQVKNSARDVLMRTKHLSVLSDKLATLIPALDTCYKKKQQYGELLIGYEEKVAGLKKNLDEINTKRNKNSDPFSRGHKIGDSSSYPANDCQEIARKDPTSPSGFYWILPRCAPEPIRSWCDMNVGMSYYIWNGGASPGMPIPVSSIADVRKHCAEVGLEPLVLREANQVRSLKSALNAMGFKLTEGKGVPLAIDYGCLEGKCTGTFQDMRDGTIDLTSIMLSMSSADSAKLASLNNDASGLGFSDTHTMFFSLSNMDISAVICSTNVGLFNTDNTHVDLECNTAAKRNPIFEGPTNTNIVAKCPPGCIEQEGDVIGTDGVYAESSSVCRSAIHAGIISDNGGTISISLEGPRTMFGSSKANGILSKRFSSIPMRSIRIGSIAKDCPIDTFEKAPTSFLQLSSVTPTVLFQKSKPVPINADSHIESMLDQAKKYIDEVYGVDAAISFSATDDAANVLNEIRRRIKPAERFNKMQAPKVLTLVSSVEEVATDLNAITGEYQSLLNEIISKLDDVETIHTLGTQFQSWKLDSEKMKFEETWLKHDTARTKGGPSDWGYTVTPVFGREKVIGQNSPISGISEHSPRGTFLQLKYHRFFDFDLTVDVYPSPSGSFGIVFRLRDYGNMYMLQMLQSEKLLRLVRIKDGLVYILGQETTVAPLYWSQVKISVRRDRISASGFGKSFYVSDEGLLSGTIGFFSSGVVGGVYFDSVKVSAKSCKKIFLTPPPRAPRCSNYRQCYLSTFEQSYENQSLLGKGTWEYQKNVDGRTQVLLQTSSDAALSQALLKKELTCRDGYFCFDFNPKCKNGSVGAIFRYRDEKNYYLISIDEQKSELFRVKEGVTSSLGKTESGFIENKWNHFCINFEGVKSMLHYSIDGQTPRKIMVIDMPSDDLTSTSGRVGIETKNCPNLTFDRLSLSPISLIPANNNPVFETPIKEVEYQSLWGSCVSNVHVLNRKDHCNKMFTDNETQKQASCLLNYCDTCCSYHTSLSSTSEASTCISECSKNDEASQKQLEKYTEMLSQCLSGTTGAFEMCSANNAGCHKEVCEMCCASSPKATDKELQKKEISGCKSMCSSRFN